MIDRQGRIERQCALVADLIGREDEGPKRAVDLEALGQRLGAAIADDRLILVRVVNLSAMPVGGEIELLERTVSLETRCEGDGTLVAHLVQIEFDRPHARIVFERSSNVADAHITELIAVETERLQ